VKRDLVRPEGRWLVATPRLVSDRADACAGDPLGGRLRDRATSRTLVLAALKPGKRLCPPCDHGRTDCSYRRRNCPPGYDSDPGGEPQFLPAECCVCLARQTLKWLAVGGIAPARRRGSRPVRPIATVRTFGWMWRSKCRRLTPSIFAASSLRTAKGCRDGPVLKERANLARLVAIAVLLLVRHRGKNRDALLAPPHLATELLPSAIAGNACGIRPLHRDQEGAPSGVLWPLRVSMTSYTHVSTRPWGSSHSSLRTENRWRPAQARPRSGSK
jgi:hypothetical protein